MAETIDSRPRFSLGQVVATPGALDVLGQSREAPAVFLRRHVRGDWGELCDEDRQANEDALIHGSRLLSSYRTSRGEKIWIISEADRSSTCILLPEEY